MVSFSFYLFGCFFFFFFFFFLSSVSGEILLQKESSEGVRTGWKSLLFWHWLKVCSFSC